MFVDIGAYDMANTIDFIRWCNYQYDKVVAFEADSVSYEKSKSVIDELDSRDVTLEQKAVYCENTEITFESVPDGEYGGSRINSNGVSKVKAVALDNYFASSPANISLIKMDIEGVEKEAPIGAQR